ncbi:MAG: hypothetical protein OXF07_12855 [Rhodobacter sp.]|nr:hypothetical protein [Rhodobacter sp.]MCY4240955.1 hypothetical protein [Rhodobacter sp.]
MLTRIANVCLATVLSCGSAWAQMPLSAIDWLSDSLTESASGPLPAYSVHDESTRTGAPGPDTISVAPVGDVNSNSVGLFPGTATGLPTSLLEAADSSEITALLLETGRGPLPSMRRLLFDLLLAEAPRSGTADSGGRLFLARVDSLLDLGAVEQARALLERVGPSDPERFRRWFDVGLLTGTEREACVRFSRTPELLKSLSARVFCLARNGDLGAASVTLAAGRATGAVSGADAALLTRFLNLYAEDDTEPLPVPMHPSPLEFRIHEAIGEPLSTETLPRAFARADLRPNIGWKARVEAAERLVRSGAISANLLLGLYAKPEPEASGGVWRRSAVIQRVDAAIRERDSERIAETLPDAWREMRRKGLETVLAELYGDALREIDLEMSVGSIAYRIMLLSDEYETAAEHHVPIDIDERFLRAVSMGEPENAEAPNDVARAIASGFRAADTQERIPGNAGNDDPGAMVLAAVRKMRDSGMGDLGSLSEAIALFRKAGLEEVARRAALEAMILDKPA